LREVMKVAHNLERAEEEDMMKKALEESQRLENESKQQLNEEEEMIRQAIEASQREENERNARQ